MSWTEAKTGFDGLETKQHVIPRWERLVNNPSFSNLISAIKSTHWCIQKETQLDMPKNWDSILVIRQKKLGQYV